MNISCADKDSEMVIYLILNRSLYVYSQTFLDMMEVVDIHNEQNWLDWTDQLSEDNYTIIDQFISDEELAIFRSFFRSQQENDALTKAGIGTLDQFQIKEEIRGDYIKWLDPERDTRMTPFFDRIDTVIRMLNRYCYLSLSGAEFHLAHYPVGTYYKRHLDQFQNRNNRLISVILYLNDDWEPGNGGELKVFLDDREEIIDPVARRVVLLRSNLVEHEVLMTNKDRYSITGWLLHQPVGLGFLPH